MARPRRQEARREGLVEATLTAVGKRGLRSISLSDIANQAGLTRGAILYYYEDLDELLIEAHRAGLARFCDERDAIVDAIADPRHQLRAAIRAGLPSGPDDALMRLLYEFDVLAGTSKLHDRLVEELYTRQLGVYTRILTAGTVTGAFTPALPIDIFAMNLVALEDSYGLHIVAGNSLITVASAEAAMALLADRLGAPSE